MRMLVRRGATTLLEHARASWTAIFRNYFNDPNQFRKAAAFLSFAIEQLTDLIEGSGWEREYPRDVWQLRLSRLHPAAALRQLNHTDIQQRWLVDCAKRWLHWRLTVEEKSINTVSADLLALRRLSAFLTVTGQARYSIRQLTRPVLEQHIAWLHQQPQLGSSATIRDSISALAVFLPALQDQRTGRPTCPETPSSTPRTTRERIPLRAGGLNAHIMTQVRAHLPRWPQPDGRFLTEPCWPPGCASVTPARSATTRSSATVTTTRTSGTGTTRCAAKPTSPSAWQRSTRSVNNRPGCASSTRRRLRHTSVSQLPGAGPLTG
ncbi:hypothetical protein AB0B85_19695 [Micromonospora sp. NPDC049044]|uniref:hypothetical protein n=1 Tax=unclassified Micromonospora TaxID=2617518 RepID=UPI0033E2459E